jgi:hypothetical protein
VAGEDRHRRWRGRGTGQLGRALRSAGHRRVTLGAAAAHREADAHAAVCERDAGSRAGLLHADGPWGRCVDCGRPTGGDGVAPDASFERNAAQLKSKRPQGSFKGGALPGMR